MTQHPAENRLEIGIMYAPVGSGNLGVQALLYALIAILEDVAVQRDAPHEYFVFGAPVTPRPSALSIGDTEVPIHAIPFSGIGPRSMLSRRTLKVRQAWRSCDLVLDTGGGDSFSDIYGRKRLLGLCLSKLWQRSVGTPVILTPQTIGPYKHLLSRLISRLALRFASAVYVRDKSSESVACQWIAPEKVRLFGDLAFHLPFTRNKFDNGRVNVGINVSGLLWHGGYHGRNQFDLALDYPNAIRTLCCEFAKIRDVQLHFVPHVFGEFDRTEDDEHVCRLLASEFPGAIVPSTFADPVQAKSYISGLEFFAGARMHSTIAAYSSGVPVVPMAYSRKFHGLFAERLGYQRVVDLRKASERSVVAEVLRTFHERARVGSEIAPEVAKFESERRRLVTALSADIANAVSRADSTS